MNSTHEQRVAAGQAPITLGQQLTAIQAIFIVVMTLGFEKLAEAIYHYSLPIMGISNAAGEPTNSWIYILPIATSIGLGLRMFWAVINVRRYLERANAKLRGETDPDSLFHLRRSIQRNVIIFHVPMLLLHGFGFDFICLLASGLLLGPNTSKGCMWFLIVYALYQYGNAFWLWILTRKLQVSPQEHAPREHIWRWNNICASSFGLVAAGLILFRGMDQENALILGCIAYIGSSALDLTVTAYHYLESPEDLAIAIE